MEGKQTDLVDASTMTGGNMITLGLDVDVFHVNKVKYDYIYDRFRLHKNSEFLIKCIPKHLRIHIINTIEQRAQNQFNNYYNRYIDLNTYEEYISYIDNITYCINIRLIDE